ncbi:hypothetical protein V8F33_010382 [Rhypophila sp. PSN 637]
MGRLSRQTGLIAAICLSLSAHRASAVPYPKDELHEAGYGYLMARQCHQYCGADNQYCCSAGTTCYTSMGIAGCAPGGGGGGGGFQFYTTTWTETKTYTSTFASPIPLPTGNCNPDKSLGQIACGSVCCKNTQYCAYSGQCLDLPGGGNGGGGGGEAGGGVWTTTNGDGQVITTQYSAPYRVTSGAIATGTAASATATSSGGVTPGGTAGGLSAGAIAGIVIGTLAGIMLLCLICFCCLVRGLWKGTMAIFGLGKKKKSETIIEEERYTRRGSTHSRRDNHGSWYGGRPSTVASRKEKKKSGGGLLGLGAALGTLWLLLGLRKDHKKKKAAAKPRSEVSSSYWSSDYTGDTPTIDELGGLTGVEEPE